ncbi:MAG: hypothetical protein KF819_03565 [Labilithrix sp.]|nr:hypothetical protein [Labilithrix sp.]
MSHRHLLVGLIGTCILAIGVGCGSRAEEEEAAQGEDAFSQREVDNDEVLKALQAAASNVNQYEISVKDIGVPVPSASVGASVNGFSTRGLDWFQNPAVSYPDNKRWEQGTDTGKKCQWAAVFRFQAIFENPPEEAKQMRELEGGMWRGSFWSWVDDHASTERVADPSPSYAWSSGLWKWISASGKNGICRIPTRTMVARMMKSCMAQAQSNNGDPKGCRMPRYDASLEPRADEDAGSPEAGSPEAGARDGGADAPSE